VARDDPKAKTVSSSLGSDGRSSADAELWRPCEPDIARGNRGGVGSLALRLERAPLARRVTQVGIERIFYRMLPLRVPPISY
jgi:hypothetical protein